MNRLRVAGLAFKEDEKRPPEEFWGPAEVTVTGTLSSDIDMRRDQTLARPSECPCCSSCRVKFVINVYGWPVYECESCGLGFVWPQPTNEFLTRFYGSQYWANYMGSKESLYCRDELCAHIFLRQAQCFDRIIGRRYEAKILDIGAGDGTMLRLLTTLTEVANTAVFVASDQASAVTGTTVNLSCGGVVD